MRSDFVIQFNSLTPGNGFTLRWFCNPESNVLKMGKVILYNNDQNQAIKTQCEKVQFKLRGTSEFLLNFNNSDVIGTVFVADSVEFIKINHFGNMASEDIQELHSSDFVLDLFLLDPTYFPKDAVF